MTATIILQVSYLYHLKKGVISNNIGPPIDSSRAKGYNMGVVLTLESKENLKTWAESPEHLRFVTSSVIQHFIS